MSYNNLDPVYLESLHYRSDNKLPLHIALDAQNTRMVNLILTYMSMIEYTAIDSIKDILKDLVVYTEFAQYMREAMF